MNAEEANNSVAEVTLQGIMAEESARTNELLQVLLTRLETCLQMTARLQVPSDSGAKAGTVPVRKLHPSELLSALQLEMRGHQGKLLDLIDIADELATRVKLL